MYAEHYVLVTINMTQTFKWFSRLTLNPAQYFSGMRGLHNMGMNGDVKWGDFTLQHTLVESLFTGLLGEV